MSTICIAACGSTDLPVNYHDDCAPIQRQSGGDLLIAVRCTYAWTDITDPAEWTAAIASGDIGLFPIGKWELPAPTLNNLEDATGCGRTIEQSRTYSMPFETPYSANDCSDFRFWKTLDANQTAYNIILKSCDGLFYISDAWYNTVCDAATAPTTDNGGFEFSFSVAPYENREGTSDNIVRWQATFDIKKVGLIAAVPLPGVEAVL